MFKNMKLGTKIGVGFGLLILIAMVQGSVAVWNMKAVITESTDLAQKDVPTVMVNDRVGMFSQKAMYAMRGYVLSEEKHFLEETRKNLAELKKALKQTKELAVSQNLAKLKDAAEQAEVKLNEYEQLVNESAAKVDLMAEGRKKLGELAINFLKRCSEYLDSQNETLGKEIKDGADAATLEDRLVKIGLINKVIALGNQVIIATQKKESLGDSKIIKNAMRDLDAVIKNLDEIESVTKQQVNLRQIADARTAVADYKNVMNELNAAWLAQNDLNKRRDAAGVKILEVAQNSIKESLNEAKRVAGEAAGSLGSASNIMIGGLIGAFIVGILLAFFITRSITKPVNRIIAGLNEGSEQVAAASAQVSSSSQQLAEGASEQAASIEETSSSLEEIASMAKQNADNAQQGNTLMDNTKHLVAKANESMKEMGLSMGEISKSGEEIGKIIKSIDEIAFQTNLLALNAAVEAARAGEHGMGFAVVADEVRNLAQRSAEAAKNTSNLIEDMVKKIKEGSTLLKTTDEAFQEVVTGADKAGELVGEIAAASQEQTSGVDQVNVAVAQMDKVVQQVAANSEESASAAEELNAQAENMKSVVAELAAMVGGSSNGANGKAARVAVKHHPVHVHAPVHEQHALHPAPKKEKKAKESENNKKEHVPALQHAGDGGKKAKEAIPLDDGEFKDF